MKKRFWILAGILLGMILLSLCVGRYELSVKKIFSLLIGQAGEERDRVLFFQIRLSRTFFAVLSGAMLSLAGMTYQTVFSNPLVSPDVLGVTSGCSIGAILSILMGNRQMYVHQSLSFLFGMGTVCVTLFLAAMFRGERRYQLILAGIVVGSLANSVIMTFKYTADPSRELPSIEYWLMGTFQNASWEKIGKMLPLAVGASLFLFFMRWKIKILTLGDEEAQSLGVYGPTVRLSALLCATILVAVVVSAAGSVAWIGLIAPHAVRMTVGEDFSGNFLFSLMMGACILLFADLCARTLFPAEVPISILTSFFGAVLLGLFLMNQRRRG